MYQLQSAILFCREENVNVQITVSCTVLSGRTCECTNQSVVPFCRKQHVNAQIQSVVTFCREQHVNVQIQSVVLFCREQHVNVQIQSVVSFCRKQHVNVQITVICTVLSGRTCKCTNYSHLFRSVVTNLQYNYFVD